MRVFFRVILAGQAQAKPYVFLVTPREALAKLYEIREEAVKAAKGI